MFFCPAFERYSPPVEEKTAERTCYGTFNPKYSTITNLPANQDRPFGYAPGQDSTPQQKPMKISTVQSLAAGAGISISDFWALVDLDRVGCPNVGWASEIPPTPVHGPRAITCSSTTTSEASERPNCHNIEPAPFHLRTN